MSFGTLLHMRLRGKSRPKKMEMPFQNAKPSPEEMLPPPPPHPPDPKLVGQAHGGDPKQIEQRHPNNIGLGEAGGEGVEIEIKPTGKTCVTQKLRNSIGF